MRLTPLDIKKQDFKRVMRGLDPDEVHAFLQMLGDQWQELTDENNRLDRRIVELESKLVHYKEVEEAMQEALKTARQSSRQTLESAKLKAKGIVEEALSAATRIQKKAEDEKYNLRRDIERIRSRRTEVIARLRALLKSELAILDDHVQHYPVEREVSPVDDLDETVAASRSLATPDPVDEGVKAVERLDASTESREQSRTDFRQDVPSRSNEHGSPESARYASSGHDHHASGELHHDDAGPTGDHDGDSAAGGTFGNEVDEDTLIFGTSENDAPNGDARPEADAHQSNSRPSEQPPVRQSSPEMDKIRKILDDLA